MKREAYPAARTISPRLHAYFARHREAAVCSEDCPLAPLPDAQTIEAIVDAAFWASLRREEGYVPRISLAFLSPEHAKLPLMFARPLPLDPGALIKVAPAVEQPGIHLGVWRVHDDLCAWGAIRTIPVLCFVLEVAAPGLLVIKHHSGDVWRKFINVAVLEGDQIKLIEERPSGPPEPTPLLQSLLRFDAPGSGRQAAITILQLAVAMRAHGHGGLLLLVPADSECWRDSVVQPLPYATFPPFSELACLNRQTPGPEEQHLWQEAVAPAIQAIGGLTAVDGAVVLNSHYELLGFGAKIARRRGSPRVEQILLTEPIEGAAPALVHPEQLGGTRHLSAAQFVHDQRDAVALVASQDGRFTIMEWSRAENTVHAHRVETLLL